MLVEDIGTGAVQIYSYSAHAASTICARPMHQPGSSLIDACGGSRSVSLSVTTREMSTNDISVDDRVLRIPPHTYDILLW